ncbi:hypothetical protein [Sphingobium sp.]
MSIGPDPACSAVSRIILFGGCMGMAAILLFSFKLLAMLCRATGAITGAQ